MPLYPHQRERRVRRTGHVETGGRRRDVAWGYSLGDVVDLMGEAVALELLKTGRFEVTGRYVPLHIVLTLEPDK